MRHLEPVFGRNKAHDTTAAKIAWYASDCLDEGAAQATVATEPAALKRMLRVVAELDKLTTGPLFPGGTRRSISRTPVRSSLRSGSINCSYPNSLSRSPPRRTPTTSSSAPGSRCRGCSTMRANRGTPTRRASIKVWKAPCLTHAILGRDGAPKILHDCRRSAVRRYEREGVSREIAKRLVGHKTDDMYGRYNIVTTKDLREAVQRVAQSQPESVGHS